MLIAGKTMLERVVERVKKAKLIKNVIVATSKEREDETIVRLCQKKKIKFFRGSLNDVLDRYYQAAKKNKIKHICRVTADCPLIDPKIIDLAAKEYLKGRYDYVSTAYPLPTFPDGLDVEIFSFRTLKKTWQEAKLPSEREHVTPYIWKNHRKFKIKTIKNNQNLSDMRWTVDEERDLKFIREIYQRLSKKDKIFYMEDVLNLLKKEPELMEINKGIIRNQGYLKSLREDKIKNEFSKEK